MQPIVLIVDDSITMRALVRQALEVDAYTVIEACHGAAALAALERVHADLVITDLLMPEMDGITLTRALRADARFATLPVLVLTTETGPGVMERGRDAGATGWLGKPFHPDTLRQTVRRVLAERV
jgi:two-component system chemotaxis response regulator CheY